MYKQNINKIGGVILAAGKGTRLNCVDIPKVMKEIGGRPIVSYTVETLQKMNFTDKQICLVVGFQREKVKEFFSDKVSYATQEEQKGTAHAAFVGISSLPKDIETVLILNGDDSAFYKAETLEKIIEHHLKNSNILTLLSVKLPQPGDLGRIVRHENGDIEIIEKEYFTEEQKKINEINTNTFVFNRKWFEEMFPKMPMLRKLGEYGLPTVLAMAREQKKKYEVICLENSNEWFGINNPEQLAEADQRKKQEK
ncbi:MAG: sugar phosphate nucleotidyltransferase [Patescibacteria group bacterium]